MEHKYGNGLIGRKVKIFTNGDISVLDTPNGNLRKNFGPEYGSQGIVYGTIVDFRVQFNELVDYDDVKGAIYGTRIGIWIEYNDNGRLGLNTSEWSFKLNKFKEYLEYLEKESL